MGFGADEHVKCMHCSEHKAMHSSVVLLKRDTKVDSNADKPIGMMFDRMFTELVSNFNQNHLSQLCQTDIGLELAMLPRVPVKNN